MSLILALETSCDETAISLLESPGRIVAAKIASQADLHSKFGGVVPEIASRNHLRAIGPLLDTCLAESSRSLRQIDAVAATRGPGLLTSLLVGYSTAKGIAIGLRKPFLGINHLEGHLLSPFFGMTDLPRSSVNLVVSGGHTMLVWIEEVGDYRLIGRTLDDAAGEAFDKVAKMMGLPYPGGPAIEKAAVAGDPMKYHLPRSMLHSHDAHFSFSGLKTAVRYLLPKLKGDFVADLAASFQEAVVDVLVAKTINAAKVQSARCLAVSGGVSANGRLRTKMQEAAATLELPVWLAAPALSTDNAVMIAYAASQRWERGWFTDLEQDADPALPLEGTSLN